MSKSYDRPMRLCDDDGNLLPAYERFVYAWLTSNDRIESYIEHVARNKNMGRTAASGAAGKLLRQPAIKARIAELMAEMDDLYMVTLASVTRELNESRALAMTLNQPSAATQATMAKAKLHGLEHTSVWVSGPNNQPVQTLDVSKLDTETLRKLAAARVDVDENSDETE